MTSIYRRAHQRPAGSGADDLRAAVLPLRDESLGHGPIRGIGPMRLMCESLDILRRMSSHEAISAALTLLCRDFGFAQAMFSTIREHDWLPWRLYGRGADSTKPGSFGIYRVGVPVPLEDSPAEAALIRGCHHVVVSRPTVSDPQSYLVAPIALGAHVIGMLHVDSPDNDEIVISNRFDLLEMFAECLAVVYERAVLAETVSRHRIEIEQLCAAMDQIVRPAVFEGSPMTLTVGPGADAQHECEPPSWPELTPREREVMAHVATGATNRDIGRYLLISEGTVKSHLKRIAKKLDTTSRAAALALYLDRGSGVAADDRLCDGGHAETNRRILARPARPAEVG